MLGALWFFIINVTGDESRCRAIVPTVSTVDWYTRNASKFIGENDSTDHRADYQRALSFVSVPKPVVLDVGCAQGRDMDGFLKMGVGRVMGVEPSKPLAEAARARTGQRVFEKGFETIVVGEDIAPQSVNLIWAMASFLHIPEAQQLSAFQKASEILASDGIISVTYKVGNGERLEQRGDFNLLYMDMTEERLKALISKVPALQIVSIDIQEDYNRRGLFWIRAIIKKK